eukprot:TRINITY_DN733_c0_g1_i7.p1 TRINITY_DN733_c0_g1~~TRINITY_DN733_c0_g1_i7.p1  ORF type:complete len:711 (+),score=96.37 TRINITY_DN733_c0_g1_i7:868-3000(+)
MDGKFSGAAAVGTKVVFAPFTCEGYTCPDDMVEMPSLASIVCADDICQDVECCQSLCVTYGSPDTCPEPTCIWSTTCEESICKTPSNEGYDFSGAAGKMAILGFAPMGVTCENGYSGQVSYRTCNAHDTEYSVIGCLATCSVPTNVIYDFTAVAGNFTIAGFSPRGVSCADGYTGVVVYKACSSAGDPFTVAGCQEADCVAPQVAGYDFGGVTGTFTQTGFSVTGVACAPGYSGNANATACAAKGGAYDVTGCRPNCVAPEIPGQRGVDLSTCQGLGTPSARCSALLCNKWSSSYGVLNCTDGTWNHDGACCVPERVDWESITDGGCAGADLECQDIVIAGLVMQGEISSDDERCLSLCQDVSSRLPFLVQMLYDINMVDMILCWVSVALLSAIWTIRLWQEQGKHELPKIIVYSFFIVFMLISLGDIALQIAAILIATTLTPIMSKIGTSGCLNKITGERHNIMLSKFEDSLRVVLILGSFELLMGLSGGGTDAYLMLKLRSPDIPDVFKRKKLFEYEFEQHDTFENIQQYVDKYARTKNKNTSDLVVVTREMVDISYESISETVWEESMFPVTVQERMDSNLPQVSEVVRGAYTGFMVATWKAVQMQFYGVVAFSFFDALASAVDFFIFTSEAKLESDALLAAIASPQSDTQTGVWCMKASGSGQPLDSVTECGFSVSLSSRVSPQLFLCCGALVLNLLRFARTMHSR